MVPSNRQSGSLKSAYHHPPALSTHQTLANVYFDFFPPISSLLVKSALAAGSCDKAIPRPQ
jgi:hypothetical protein